MKTPRIPKGWRWLNVGIILRADDRYLSMNGRWVATGGAGSPVPHEKTYIRRQSRQPAASRTGRKGAT